MDCALCQLPDSTQLVVLSPKKRTCATLTVLDGPRRDCGLWQECFAKVANCCGHVLGCRGESPQLLTLVSSAALGGSQSWGASVTCSASS